MFKILLSILIGSQAFAVSPTRFNDIVVKNQAAIGSTSVASTSAVLDLVSTTKGFNPPRMTTTQRDAIASPTAGMLIYNTTTSQVNVYTGSAWGAVAGSGGGTYPDYTTNGGFESGTASWTASGGTFTTTSTAANVGEGTAAGDWDSNSASQTLTNASFAITSGGELSSAPVIGTCMIKAASGTATHTLQLYDGSNILSSVTITSSTTGFIRTNTGIVNAPASGTIALRLVSVASNEPEIYIDSCHVLNATTAALSQISQSTLVATGFFPATGSCSVTRNNTALGAFGTAASCPGPTIGTNDGPGVLQTTDVDLPTKFTVNNLAPGTYEVGFAGPVFDGTNERGAFAINDGTTTFGQTGQWFTTVGAQFAVQGAVTYTTAANHTFELYASSAANTVTIDIGSSRQQVFFWVRRYPSGAQTAFTPAQTPAFWSGYHDSTCSWARTNTALGDPTADASCALVQLQNTNFGSVTSALSAGNALPGIVWTPNANHCYQVTANTVVTGATLAAMEAAGLTFDGGTTWAGGTDSFRNPVANHSVPFSFSGITCATSTTAITAKIQTAASSGAITIDQETTPVTQVVTWSVMDISASFPAPLIANSVVSGSSGVTNVEAVTFGGNSTLSAACTTGTCTSPYKTGGVSSVTFDTTGKYFINFVAGTFSAAPVCTCNAASNAANDFIAPITYSTWTSTQVHIQSISTAGSSTNDSGMCTCIGPK